MQVFSALQVNQEPFRIEKSARVWMSTALSPPVINHYPLSPPAKSGKEKILGIFLPRSGGSPQFPCREGGGQNQCSQKVPGPILHCVYEDEIFELRFNRIWIFSANTGAS